MGVAISYAELDAAERPVRRLAAAERGFKRGDRVAIMMPNLLQYPVVLFGILRAGLTVVNVNPLYTARELEHQLKDSGARGIVILENFAHTLVDLHGPGAPGHRGHHPDRRPVPGAEAPTRQLRGEAGQEDGARPGACPAASASATRSAAGGRHSLQPVDVGHKDMAFLQYTGGTTGVSKGAMLTHRNMVANVLQASAWLGTGPQARAGDGDHGPAAVSHLLPHRELHGVHDSWAARTSSSPTRGTSRTS